jgi:septal ring factor EnvC (AmiA/AmiB activator)
LEIRLATEELWAELAGSAPPAALTRSLGRIRSRLADHYRMANADLQQKKEEIEGLRDQLSDQYEKLVRQKRSFDTWASECRDEVEHQAARLQARSDELDRRETETGEHARSLQAEKLQLQQEIRRLRAKLLGQAQMELPAV